MKYPISLILFRCGVIDKTLRSKLFRHNNIVKIEKAINEMRRVFNILASSKSGKLDSLTEIRVLNRDDILLHEIVKKTWVSTKHNLNLDKRENMTIGTFMIYPISFMIAM